jgi:hypothetical protein
MTQTQTQHMHAPVEMRHREQQTHTFAEQVDPGVQLSASDQDRCNRVVAQALKHRANEKDIEQVTQQLGRYPRGIVSVAVRCHRCGAPVVVITRPLITDHVARPTPFPTTFYVTNPVAVKAISRLEATGVMNELTHQLQSTHPDPKIDQVKKQYQRAHAMYLEVRHILAHALHDSEEHIAGISAGGMPTRVKCLHALIGQSLVMGPGVNPIGDWALKEIRPEFSLDVCRCQLPAEHSSMKA